jgi:hypothetical protein
MTLGGSPDAIGMMEGAFFVSKSKLLEWVNRLLVDANVRKVEDCANGAAYCRIIEKLFPGRLNLKKINNAAKHDYEFIGNYKLLQKAFDDCGIKKHIEVDKLIRGKFQDNLEFLQWLKSFFESKRPSAEEAPPRRRHSSGSPVMQQRRSLKKLETPSLEVLQRERDFFLNKLQNIENLTNDILNAKINIDTQSLVQQIQHILFNPEFI